MNSWKDLARQGLRGALETRRRAGLTKSEPICIFDVAERLQVSVWFRGGSSFGGMYAKASQAILVPSLRPPGRQAFTCAHELAHWYFGHGTRLDHDDFWERGEEAAPEERLANFYASYLLMPSWAVKEAFERRALNPESASPLEIYVVASQLAVGYETLIQHLRRSLAMLSEQRAEILLRTSPKELRRYALDVDRPGHLVVADRAWVKVAIDLQVGDAVLLPGGVVVEGKCVAPVGRLAQGTLAEGRMPGICRAHATDPSWAAFIRVSRREFEGRSIYRHLEDPDIE